MEKIIRGTTPSLILDFTGITEVDLADVDSVSLIMRHAHQDTDLSEGVVITPSANQIVYSFSQEETLAMRSNQVVRLQMDILVDGQRYRVLDKEYRVEDTMKNEVMT